MTGGCGSTSPIAPTSASTAAQYPSLVGHYFDGGLNELRLQYRDTGTTIGWRCDTMADVSSQRDGSFSGDVGFNGVGSREPPCSNSFGFIAEIRPDGTITNFRIDGGLGLGGCTSASDASVSGTATDSEIRIVIMDRAICLDWRSTRVDFSERKDADRIVTISLKRLHDSARSISDALHPS